MKQLKIIGTVIAVFMASIGYGQKYGEETTVMGSDNIAAVVKSSLNAIPNLRVGSVIDNFVYKATYNFRKDENTHAYNYHVFGKLLIDDVAITMSDGEVVTFKNEGGRLLTYHEMVNQTARGGYDFTFSIAIDGTTSVDGKQRSFSNSSVSTNTVVNETDRSSCMSGFEHSLGVKYVDFSCSGLTSTTISKVKSDIERVRNLYDRVKKSKQDLQNHQNSGNNSSSENSTQTQNPHNNNTYNSNTNNNNFYNNSNRQRVDDHNERIRQQGNQIYQNTQTYSRNVDQIIGGVRNQFDQWHQNRMAAEAEEDDGEWEETTRDKRIREAQERKEREEQATIAKNEKINYINKSVSEIFKRYPSGELPTSATRVNTNKLYYFVYTNINGFTGNEIYNGNAIVYTSNIFAIGQYPDGTWPMKTTIEEEIRNLTSWRGTIHGYYTSEREAQTALNNFKNEITSTGIRINNISYEGKNANVQQQNQADNKQRALDYWGNPIKNSNTTQPQKTQPQQQQTNKPKLDYWGNPIKE